MSAGERERERDRRAGRTADTTLNPAGSGPRHSVREVLQTAEMVASAWMHEQITAEEYESWSEEQCADIEIVDGMVVVRPSASKRHNRLARIVANALDAAAGPEWNADTDFDVRLQDVLLTNRRPDVVVYRADRSTSVPLVLSTCCWSRRWCPRARRPPTGT